MAQTDSPDCSARDSQPLSFQAGRPQYQFRYCHCHASGGKAVFVDHPPDSPVDAGEGGEAFLDLRDLRLIEAFNLAVFYLILVLENAHELGGGASAFGIERINAVIELVAQAGLPAELTGKGKYFLPAPRVRP